MKKINKYLLVILFLGILTGGAARADCPQNRDWREKMRTEKIAFLTSEIGLTPAEAEKFWPVYNQAAEERDKAFKETARAYNALQEAVAAGKPEKEIATLTEKYLQASAQPGQIEQRYMQKYRKILSTEKVAKLYLAEEKFRREQIHRLHERDRSGDAERNSTRQK